MLLAQRVPQLVRADRLVQPGPPRRRREQLPDRVRAHRRADRRAEQVHEHEVAHRGVRDPHPLELVGVERLHREEIQRHAALPARLGPRPVRVVLPANHMQMRPGGPAPERARVGQQVHVAAAQPAHLAAAQPGPGHQQHDQPVPRRPTGPQQRDDVAITGPLDRGLGLVQPVPGPHPPRHPPVLAAGLLGKVPVVGDLIQQWHQPGRGLPGRDRVHHHAPHRGQHAVDPRWRPHRFAARAGKHHRRTRAAGFGTRGGRAGVGQPGHEQAQLFDTAPPRPARPRAPAQEQRDRMRVRLGRGLRAVAAEPLLPQEPIRDRDNLQILVQHRPVPLPGRQPHRECPHSSSSLSAGSATTTSHEQHTRGEPQRHRQDRPDRATSCNRSEIPGEGVRVEELLELSHHSLVQYRLPSTGELVPLLQIAPSKTDAERLLVVSPELADVLSAIICRIRRPDGTVPLVRARDSHELVWLPPTPLLFQRRVGAENHALSGTFVADLLDEALARTGLSDPATGQPLRFTAHDFRRIFITDAVLNGLPPHIAQIIAGHRDIGVTMGYKAVYPDEAITAHRAFLARRRALRPGEEYRQPTDDEWQQFLGHFERRKVSVGTCGRAFATPCIHEHACVRCSLSGPTRPNATGSSRSATTSSTASPKPNAKAQTSGSSSSIVP